MELAYFQSFKMKILFALLAVSLSTVVLSEDIVTSTNSTDGSSTEATNETTIASTSNASITTDITTNSTTEDSTNSTTEAPTNSTTEAPTNSTTEAPTNSTTEAPTNSTTEAPTNSTTEAPTNSTTEVPTNSTTDKPVTPTPTPVTPTPSPVIPTVDPKPGKCTWNVTASDVTCIRAEMQAQFVIDIQGNDSYTNLGCKADLLSHDCPSKGTQKLILSEEDKYVLTMEFEKDSDDKVSATNITLQYTLPDGDQLFAYNDSEKLFTVKVGNSYLCKTDKDVYLGNVTMKILEMRIQAFAEKKDTDFGTAEECNADDPVSDIIPIAVGVVLVALVLVVLIAYLIGRRRKSQKGYQTFQE